MKESKEFLNIEQEWKVPSTSKEGVTYTVRKHKDGSWSCDCPATVECKHICKEKYKEERNTIGFEGEDPFIRSLRTHKNYRLEIDIVPGQPNYIGKIAQLMSLPKEAIYEIRIRFKEN